MLPYTVMPGHVVGSLFKGAYRVVPAVGSEFNILSNYLMPT